MFERFKLWCLEQQLHLHSGKHESYLNLIRQHELQHDVLARQQLARNLLKEPEFSRIRSWAEYQRMKNANEKSG